MLLPKSYQLFESFGMTALLQNSPKFQQLFNKINFMRRQRHVIFTNFENYFGTEIIEAMFQFASLPIVRIDSTKSDEENKELMKKFNNDEGVNILVINIAFPEPPKKVNNFHIVDSNLQEAYSKIYQIYKYSNYEVSVLNPPKLNVEMYCTSKVDGKSIDDITFDEFFPYLLSQKDFWTFVKDSSLNLVVNERGRLDAVV
jgi:hypothetical protein